MVGQVVVVLDWLEGDGFAEETEVLDGDGGWEQGLQGWMDRIQLRFPSGFIAEGEGGSVIDYLQPYSVQSEGSARARCGEILFPQYTYSPVESHPAGR